ncbi:MAG: hypothetical protein IT370_29180 [Deltaproteobacteria bacterium]|nr:hypothetical protein [Deltaproteobacteria bacterium]
MKKTLRMLATLSIITLALATGCGGGGKKAPASAKSMPSSTMDCEKFADKGIELTLAADPSAADKAAEGRTMLANTCTEGVSKGELDKAKYDCAMAAPALTDFMTCVGAN